MFSWMSEEAESGGIRSLNVVRSTSPPPFRLQSVLLHIFTTHFFLVVPNDDAKGSSSVNSDSSSIGLIMDIVEEA